MTVSPSTLEALLREAPFLRALARGLVRGDPAAEDLEQETWVRALSSPPSHGSSLRAWVATVARHLLHNWSRERERRAARERAVVREEPAPSPVEILAYQEQLARVADAVRGLPEPLRLVVHLRYHEELSPPEIARRLGEPLGTVKSRLQRALQLLRERLDHVHGEAREGWCLALAPFLGTVTKAAALGPLTAGVAVMSIKIKSLVAAGTLLLGLNLRHVLGEGPNFQGWREVRRRSSPHWS